MKIIETIERLKIEKKGKHRQRKCLFNLLLDSFVYI